MASGQMPTGNSPCVALRVQLSQPYTDMPTKNTCSADCIGSPRSPASTAAQRRAHGAGDPAQPIAARREHGVGHPGEHREDLEDLEHFGGQLSR